MPRQEAKRKRDETPKDDYSAYDQTQKSVTTRSWSGTTTTTSSSSSSSRKRSSTSVVTTATGNNNQGLLLQATENDIILGRGVLYANRPGNARYYDLLDSYMSTYDAAPTKGAKTKIVRTIFQKLHDRGARFLKKASKKGDYYYAIGPKQAKKKISHAIRYRKRSQEEGEEGGGGGGVNDGQDGSPSDFRHTHTNHDDDDDDDDDDYYDDDDNGDNEDYSTNDNGGCGSLRDFLNATVDSNSQTTQPALSFLDHQTTATTTGTSSFDPTQNSWNQLTEAAVAAARAIEEGYTTGQQAGLSTAPNLDSVASWSQQVDWMQGFASSFSQAPTTTTAAAAAPTSVQQPLLLYQQYLEQQQQQQEQQQQQAQSYYQQQLLAGLQQAQEEYQQQMPEDLDKKPEADPFPLPSETLVPINYAVSNNTNQNASEGSPAASASSAAAAAFSSIDSNSDDSVQNFASFEPLLSASAIAQHDQEQQAAATAAATAGDHASNRTGPQDMELPASLVSQSRRGSSRSKSPSTGSKSSSSRGSCKLSRTSGDDAAFSSDDLQQILRDQQQQR